MKSLHLLYHELRPSRSRYSYVMECSLFEQHCQLFAKVRGGVEGVLVPQVTFDDGHRSNYEFALPILEEYGLKARFFITAGWIGQRSGYMSWPELKALRAAGHNIGAHGWSHTLLTQCRSSDLQRELTGARQYLEDGLGARVTTMSLPGGRADHRVLAGCWDAGYSLVFTSVPKEEESPFAPGATIGRLNLRSGMSSAELFRVLTPESGALAAIQRSDRIKSVAKRVLGDKVYAGVWGLLNGKEAERDELGAPAK